MSVYVSKFTQKSQDVLPRYRLPMPRLCRACRPDGFGGKEKKKLVYYILRAVLFHKMDREMYCRAVKGGWPGSGKEHQRWEEDGLISGAEPSGRGITGILMSGYFPGAFPIKEE